MPRNNVEAADEILGLYFPVLDNGFISLVDYMGTDDDVVAAARTSYAKNTKKVSDDRGLIRRLMRDRHTSPFEFVELKFHVRAPSMSSNSGLDIELATFVRKAIDSQRLRTTFRELALTLGDYKARTINREALDFCEQNVLGARITKIIGMGEICVVKNMDYTNNLNSPITIVFRLV